MHAQRSTAVLVLCPSTLNIIFFCCSALRRSGMIARFLLGTFCKLTRAILHSQVVPLRKVACGQLPVFGRVNRGYFLPELRARM